MICEGKKRRGGRLLGELNDALQPGNAAPIDSPHQSPLLLNACLFCRALSKQDTDLQKNIFASYGWASCVLVLCVSWFLGYLAAISPGETLFGWLVCA